MREKANAGLVSPYVACAGGRVGIAFSAVVVQHSAVDTKTPLGEERL